MFVVRLLYGGDPGSEDPVFFMTEFTGSKRCETRCKK